MPLVTLIAILFTLAKTGILKFAARDDTYGVIILDEMNRDWEKNE